MTEPLPTVLEREGDVVRAARPLFEEGRVIRARVIDDLRAIDDELRTLRKQARDTLDEARREAQLIQKRARKQGRVEAMQECMEELGRARAEYGKLCSRAERDMVTLAFQIARRIIGHSIDVQPDVVRDIVGKALTSARGRREIVIYVHPKDYDIVESARQDYARDMEGVPVYFEADSSLQRGDSVIETESGRIDARLETQLDVLRETLLGGDRGGGLTEQNS